MVEPSAPGGMIYHIFPLIFLVEIFFQKNSKIFGLISRPIEEIYMSPAWRTSHGLQITYPAKSAYIGKVNLPNVPNLHVKHVPSAGHPPGGASPAGPFSAS